MRFSCKHLWESLIHAGSYLLVLLCSQLCEFANALVCLVAEHLDLFKRLLACWCELSKRVGTLKNVVRIIIVVLVAEVALTVSSVA